MCGVGKLECGLVDRENGVDTSDFGKWRMSVEKFLTLVLSSVKLCRYLTLEGVHY